MLVGYLALTKSYTQYVPEKSSMKKIGKWSGRPKYQESAFTETQKKPERLVGKENKAKEYSFKKQNKKSYRKRIHNLEKAPGESLFLNGIGGRSFIHLVLSMAASTLLKISEFL